MKFAWKALVGLGVLLALGALAMDTTVGSGYRRVHNIGLQQQQTVLLILGCVLFLAGIVLFAVVKLKQTSEEDAWERDRQAARAVARAKAKAEVDAWEQEARATERPLEVGKVEKVRKPAGGIREDRMGLRFAVGVIVGLFWALIGESFVRGGVWIPFLVTPVGLALWPRAASYVLPRLLYANALVATTYFCWKTVNTLRDVNLTLLLQHEGFYFLIGFYVGIPSALAVLAYWLSSRNPPEPRVTDPVQSALTR